VSWWLSKEVKENEPPRHREHQEVILPREKAIVLCEYDRSFLCAFVSWWLSKEVKENEPPRHCHLLLLIGLLFSFLT